MCAHLVLAIFLPLCEIEVGIAGQLKMLLQALGHMPEARASVDYQALSWVLALLFLRLAESPLDDPTAIVASPTDLIFHALFVDSQQAEP